MNSAQINKLMTFLNSLNDDQLYEAGKLITHLVGLRHSLRVMEGSEIRPGKRGVRWKKKETSK